MKNVDVLNLMAEFDGELPFSGDEVPDNGEQLFDSVSEANKAFKFSQLVRNNLRIQAKQTNIPASWTEMINAYPVKANQNQHRIENNQKEHLDFDEIPAAFFRLERDDARWESAEAGVAKNSLLARFAKLFGGKRRVWSGGIATACLVLILVDPTSDEAPVSGLGGAVGTEPLISLGEGADTDVMLQASNKKVSEIRRASEELPVKRELLEQVPTASPQACELKGEVATGDKAKDENKNCDLSHE